MQTKASVTREGVFRRISGPRADYARRMTLSSGRILLAVILVVAGGFAVRWMLSGDDGSDGPIFRVAAAETRELVQTVEATGRLRPRDPVLVMAPVEGRLAEVLVQARDMVKQGDLLARLDAGGLAFEVRRSQAGVAAARGALAEARAASVEATQQLERARKLAGRGQLSQADLQAAVSADKRARGTVQVASAKLAESQAALRAARFAAAQTDIVAPRDGVVLSVPEQLGLAVSPGGPILFTVSAPLEVLRLEAAVGEADIGKLTVGQPAQFEVQAYPQQTFSARVESIGVTARTGEGVATYPVQLSAPNPEGRLLPGMSAAVRFEVARVKNALAVRDSALRFRPVDAPDAPPRSRVFKVRKDGQVQIISVSVGVTDGIWAEVRPENPATLQPGDEVAVGYLSKDRRSTPGLKIGG